MSDMNVSQLLSQMRGMSLEASGSKEAEGSGGFDFAAMLKQTIGSVNDTQQAAGNLTKAFEMGDSKVSLAEVMIASQKANVSFQATMQVRNKLVEAYKDVMNMPM